MRTAFRLLATAAAALGSASLATAQISVTGPTITMVNGNASPALNGPLGNFVGNVNASGDVPAQPDGTVGLLPAAEFATTPVITQSVLAAATAGITVPAEFTATVFATPPVISAVTAVGAAPDGTLYVAVDGNGASSAYNRLGRVVRLKDTNNDGVADEAKPFIAEIDSPRGVLWNHDHLIVMAAPNITAHYDRNRDGVVDETKVLIRNVGRTLADARVDHGQNNLDMGIDGWVYLSMGDQGNRESTGADGRVVTLRGGGTLRFRPDGTGLEIFAWNTRNVYGVAVGPTLEAFARDNTNDGGGWNVRFHHFSGLTDHGYPSLFTNFPEEIVTALADFGGGSGTGATWIDEPGYPAKWNDAPYTADYGQRGLFLHRLTPVGATYSLPGYALTEASVNNVPLLAPGQTNGVAVGNERFIDVANVMDADVDGNSAVYIGKWSGGFGWAGRMQGMVYRVAPKDFTPAPMPNWDTATAAELVQVLAGPSHVRRIEAQRAIVRRAAQIGQQAAPMLEALASDRTKHINNRTAALFTYKLLRGGASTPYIAGLVSDPSIAALALRALGDDITQARSIPINVVTGALSSPDARTRKEALMTLARAHSVASAPAITRMLGDSDPIVAQIAVQVLRSLRAVDATLAVIDDPAATPPLRKGSLQVLQTIREPRVIDALTQRLRGDQDIGKRQEIVNALARLANTETAWNGTWWATRPSVVGPYYAPTAWSETPKVMAALNGVLDRAGPEEVLAMGRTYLKQGVSAGPAVSKFLAFADTEPALVPQITSYFATADEIPANALPVLNKVAAAPATAANVRAQAITALSKTADRTAWATVFPAVQLLNAPGAAPAGGGRGGGGGGRGGAAAPAAPAIPGATQIQTLLVASMDTANNARLQAVAAERTALLQAALSGTADAATLNTRANALAQAELALAQGRADSFARIQASIARFNPQQAAALAAQQATAAPAAAPAAAGGRGGGGGGRGGAPALTPTQQAQQAVLNAPRIDDVYAVVIDEAAKLNGDSSQLADAALLNLAGRKFGATPPREAAARALDTGWSDPRRRAQIILAAVTARDTTRASQIVSAMNDSDAAVARAAQFAVQQLAIDPAQLTAAASQPKIGTMQVAAVLDAVVPARGTVARGQQLSRELGCIACHTFSATEAPKGPDLTKISSILPRRELAESILSPNKTISQGFATTVINLRNGSSITGFVTGEGGGMVTIRDIAAQQTRVASADIASRRQEESSMMPAGLANELTVTEFASLLDYIESLNRP